VAGQHSMIEVRTDSHTTWKIQHLMKWYVTRHIVLHKADFERAGVAAWRWQICVACHWLKFFFACVAAEDPEFSKRVPFGEIGGKPFVVRVCEVVLMPLSRSRFFSHFVRGAWQSNRRLKERGTRGPVK
jgi:hypothetical protein